MTLITLPRLDRDDAIVGVVLGARRRGRHHRRAAARARGAAGVDRGAACAQRAARHAGHARVPRRALRRQPARGAAGDRQARAAAAEGSARARRRGSAPSPTSRVTTSRNCPRRGCWATPEDAAHHRRAARRRRADHARHLATRRRPARAGRACATPWRTASRCRPPCAARAYGASARARSSARHGARRPSRSSACCARWRNSTLLAKGLGRRDPWDVLVALALDLCGLRLPAATEA